MRSAHALTRPDPPPAAAHRRVAPPVRGERSPDARELVRELGSMLGERRELVARLQRASGAAPPALVRELVDLGVRQDAVLRRLLLIAPPHDATDRAA